MKVKALGNCHPDCRYCAMDFWKWLKGRMNQMDRPRRGEEQSFSEAAATSIKPEK